MPWMTSRLAPVDGGLVRNVRVARGSFRPNDGACPSPGVERLRRRLALPRHPLDQRRIAEHIQRMRRLSTHVDPQRVERRQQRHCLGDALSFGHVAPPSNDGAGGRGEYAIIIRSNLEAKLPSSARTHR